MSLAVRETEQSRMSYYINGRVSSYIFDDCENDPILPFYNALQLFWYPNAQVLLHRWNLQPFIKNRAETQNMPRPARK